ncbi:hypothetical protein SEA_LADYBIRD_39 [Mycobacterium phage LadyBird]|uniref:hypothetical protein n=1 Tax=Mycobacterium phage LadyBird TaxID=1718166 RepID=UPI0006CE4533|nr:hypothetical protein SEA_LADYBIRD_39 [Mycobacterium phage LadyBird]ALF02180.1 hypothetical protein SEA_LADYBIRD_39 [Mycobacterium phage LadyBird]
MQIAFIELTDINNGATGHVNVEQIASVVRLPDDSLTIVGGSFGNVMVSETAEEVLQKIADVVNLVNGDVDPA